MTFDPHSIAPSTLRFSPEILEQLVRPEVLPLEPFEFSMPVVLGDVTFSPDLVFEDAMLAEAGFDEFRRMLEELDRA